MAQRNQHRSQSPEVDAPSVTSIASSPETTPTPAEEQTPAAEATEGESGEPEPEPQAEPAGDASTFTLELPALAEATGRHRRSIEVKLSPKANAVLARLQAAMNRDGLNMRRPANALNFLLEQIGDAADGA